MVMISTQNHSNHMTKNPIKVLIPVETISRELDSKLFIASTLARHGITSVIAQHNVIDSIFKKSHGGVYLGKNIFKEEFHKDNHDKNTALYKCLKARGFHLCHLDEEGGIYLGDKEYWKKMLSMRLIPRYLDKNDTIFTWGDFQKRHYQSSENPENSPKIVSTSHPRFDICKPSSNSFFHTKKEDIKKQYGDFLLINTNLTFANNSLGFKNTFQAQIYHAATTKELVSEFFKPFTSTCHVFHNLIFLIVNIADTFPQINFVVRPHPSENIDYYKEAFQHFKNIYVVREGNVIEWILASKAIIQDGCTTAIEAFLAEKPVINYKSVSEDIYNLRIPNKVGIKCNTTEQVIHAITDIIDPSYQSSCENSFDEVDHSMMNCLKNTNSLELITHHILKTLANIDQTTLKQSTIRSITFRNFLINSFKYPIRKFLTTKHGHYLANKSMFPGFNKNTIETKIDSINNLVKSQSELKLFTKTAIVIGPKEKIIDE